MLRGARCSTFGAVPYLFFFGFPFGFGFGFRTGLPAALLVGGLGMTTPPRFAVDSVFLLSSMRPQEAGTCMQQEAAGHGKQQTMRGSAVVFSSLSSSQTSASFRVIGPVPGLHLDFPRRYVLRVIKFFR